MRTFVPAAILLLCPVLVFSAEPKTKVTESVDEEIVESSEDPAIEALRQYQQLKIESLKRDLAIARVDVEESCKPAKKKANQEAAKAACDAARSQESSVFEKIREVTTDVANERIAYEKKLAAAKVPPPPPTPTPTPTVVPAAPVPEAATKGRNPASVDSIEPMVPAEPLQTEVISDPNKADAEE